MILLSEITSICVSQGSVVTSLLRLLLFVPKVNTPSLDGIIRNRHQASLLNTGDIELRFGGRIVRNYIFAFF